MNRQEVGVEAGLVRRRASQRDGRRSRLELTELGEAVFRVVRRVRRAMVTERLGQWPARDQEEFARLLSLFVE